MDGRSMGTGEDSGIGVTIVGKIDGRSMGRIRVKGEG